MGAQDLLIIVCICSYDNNNNYPTRDTSLETPIHSPVSQPPHQSSNKFEIPERPHSAASCLPLTTIPVETLVHTPDDDARESL